MERFELCSVAVLQPFMKFLNARGIDADGYLEGQYIPPEMVASGEGKIIKKQAWKFFNEVERREGIDTLGFLGGDDYSIQDLGSLGSSLQEAVTLKDAIDTFSYLIWSFAEGNSIWLQQGAIYSWLCCRTEMFDHRVRAADHHTILILREIIRLAAGPHWQPDEIWLCSEPSNALRKLPGFSSVKTEFLKDSAGIRFESTLLPVPPIKGNQSNILGSVEYNPTESPPESIQGALHQFLTSQLTHGYLPSVDEVLEILDTSRMTLFRSLAADGMNYRKLVERVRFNRAVHLLKNSPLSVKEIAHELCYTAPNNFSRAFLRLSGQTPRAYKANFHKKSMNGEDNH